MLKSHCLFRMGKPLELVYQYQQGRKFVDCKNLIQGEKPPKLNAKQLEFIYNNQVYYEIKLDVREMAAMAKLKRNNSIFRLHELPLIDLIGQTQISKRNTVKDRKVYHKYRSYSRLTINNDLDKQEL